MKKIISLIIGAILLLNVTFIFGKESVLIDFDLLKANGNGYDPSVSKSEDEIANSKYNEHFFTEKDVVGNLKVIPQHMPTVMDYSAIAGSNFSEEDVKQMTVSLSAYNWFIELNSSAASVANMKYSKAIEWHSKYPKNKNMTGFLKKDVTDDNYLFPGVTFNTNYNPKYPDEREGFTVLGARIKFPESPFNNWALIRPPFEIPAYEDIDKDYKGNPLPDDQKALERGKGRKFLNGRGVIRNVGIIKSISISVYGCQFKNSIAILYKDQDNVETEILFSQPLDFDGWRELTWRNPNYIENVQNRVVAIVPLYPKDDPYMKLSAFRIYRQGDQIGGDFVVYIKDVTVTYDLANEKRDYPIDHEEAWGIIYARNQEVKKREYDKIGRDQILRYLEKNKMDKTPVVTK